MRVPWPCNQISLVFVFANFEIVSIGKRFTCESKLGNIGDFALLCCVFVCVCVCVCVCACVRACENQGYNI